MKRITYIIVLVVLLIAAGYFYFKDGSTSFRPELSDFSIEDTAAVTKIFIANPEGKTAELSRRSDGKWMINDKYIARKDAVDLLLETMKKISVREAVPESGLERTIKILSSQATKVEIYLGDSKPEKVYYVGHATRSNYGTNMLLEIDGKKSRLPYVTHIQGFYGYLSSRFFTDEDLWRDVELFHFKPEEIQSIELSYLEKPLKSFRLNRISDEKFEVIDLSTGNKIEPLYEAAVSEYLSRYARVNFELIANTTPSEEVDSILNTPPLHTIKVEDTDGNIKLLETYYKPAKGSPINPATGEPYGYNIDRLYGWIDETDLVTIQWPMLDEILAYLDDFRKPENVDN